MRNISIIKRNAAIIFCLIPLFWGCGEKQTETTPVKTKVISQKIAVEKGSGAKPAGKSADAKTAAAPKKAVAKIIPAPKVEPPDVAVSPQKPAVTAKVEKEEKPLTTIAYLSAESTDPFAPLFQEQPAAAKKAEKSQAGVAKSEEELAQEELLRRIPRTPLEKMDLSQLKLVAIIRSGQGNKALVQDASGKGYVLNKGTYVGLNAGFVAKITRNKVIVEEKIKDRYGKIVLNQKELVLQKPVGEI